MEFRKLLDIINENTDTSSIKESLLKKMKIMPLSDYVEKHSKDQELEEEEKTPKFLGATYRKPGEEEFRSYADRVAKKQKVAKDKTKFPYVHSSNISLVYKPKEGDQVDAISGTPSYEYDLEALKEMFTVRPTYILKQNDKMKHSDGSSSIFFNIGLPAIVGLAVDEETNEFIIINTCPGAGKCINYCFVGKGGYVQYSPPSTHMTRNLNFLVNDPNGWKEMLKSEIKKAYDKYKKKNTQVVIRWHDAGDFFSPAYKDLAFSVAKEFPEVDFYAYTKIANIALSEKPKNFVFNFSQGARSAEEKKIDFKKVKHSSVVDRALFSDLVHRVVLPDLDKKGKQKIDKKTGTPKTIKKLEYKGPTQINTLKSRIAKVFGLDQKSILTYDEMLKTPMGKPLQYNVIVKPGDGDIAATRKDVLGSYLLIH